MRPKLLLISYQFPPLGGVGVQRALSFAKYLPECGFEVHVLTPRRGVSHSYDAGLLEQVPSSVAVHRAITPELPFAVRKPLLAWMRRGDQAGADPAVNPISGPRAWRSRAADLLKRALFPDAQVVWQPFAIRAAGRIIRDSGIGAVLVTAPPFSSLVGAREIKRRFPGVRLILDFRDEWLDYYLKSIHGETFAALDGAGAGYGPLRRRAARLEAAAIAAADLVVAVTPGALDAIRARYPREPREKFALIPNGYDPEAFLDFRPQRRGADIVRFTYTGTIYAPCSPKAYLDAADALPPEIRGRMETRLIGRVAPDHGHLLENRLSRVEALGFRSHREALRELESADFALLLQTENVPVPGKLFEYLATGTPVFAVAPARSETANILRQTRGGWCCDPADHAGIVRVLTGLCTGRLPMPGFQPDGDAIRRYERPRLARQLAQAVEKILARPATACGVENAQRPAALAKPAG